jgi:alanyl-tRNA synthetase
MTEKLYYTKPDIVEWETTVTDVIEKDDYYLILLKETAFYPEGGGQPADRGFINGIEVEAVYEENEEVYHKLISPIDKGIVKCRIDRDRRFDHTQQHSGQHLLSAVCIELYDIHTIAFHLGTETVTIDVNVSEMSEQQLLHIERTVNEYIYQNREIKTYLVSHHDLAALNLRKVPDVTESIRIVEMDQIDISACCGTHVTRTGGIGVIKILKTEKQKGHIRIHFKCGVRALTDYHINSSILTKLSNNLSTNREEVIDKVIKLEKENKQFQKEILSLKEELDRYAALELLSQHPEGIINLTFNDRGLKDLQRLARHLTELTDKLIIFSSTLENKAYIAHNGSLDLHCGQLFKEELKNFNGRGGGSATNAQASFQQETDLSTFINYLYSKFSTI